MNLQAIFTAGLMGVLAQGGRSTDPGSGKCLYRGPLGRKCALGHSIPDDKYGPSLEGHGVLYFPERPDHSCARLGIIFGARSAGDAHLLEQFQSCHDDVQSREGFIAKCRAFAAAHGLEFPEELPYNGWADESIDRAVAVDNV